MNNKKSIEEIIKECNDSIKPPLSVYIGGSSENYYYSEAFKSSEYAYDNLRPNPEKDFDWLQH